MMKLTLALAVAMLAGCSKDWQSQPEVVRSSPEHSSPVVSSLNPHTANQPVGPATIVEKVDDVDCTAYGIPLYPGSKAMLASKPAKTGKEEPNVAAVTIESYDSISSITDWYTAQIKADQSYAFHDLGTLAGTTTTGFPVSISISMVDGKAIILVTVKSKSVTNSRSASDSRNRS